MLQVLCLYRYRHHHHLLHSSSRVQRCAAAMCGDGGGVVCGGGGGLMCGGGDLGFRDSVFSSFVNVAAERRRE